jgi:hypothetical protein
MQTADSLDVVGQLDVRSSTSHIRGNRHTRTFAGLSDDFCLASDFMSIQHIVFDVCLVK